MGHVMDRNAFKARLMLKDFKESYKTSRQTVMVKGSNKFILNENGFTYVLQGNSSTKISYNQAEEFLDGFSG